MTEPRAAFFVLHVADPTTPAGGWLVRVVPPGGACGRADSLVNEDDQPLVEFYDPRFPHHVFEETVLSADVHGAQDPAEIPAAGQFVGRYRFDTFMDVKGGIALDGGIPDWTAGPQAVAQLRDAILSVTAVDRARAIRESMDGLDESEILDRLGDALHEAADRLGIPEGEARDAWRLARLQDEGIDAGAEDLADLAADLMAMVEYARAEAPLPDVVNDGPEPD